VQIIKKMTNTLNNMERGVLYLIPTTLGDNPVHEVIPTHVRDIMNVTKHYIVENIRSARRYISKMKIDNKIDDLTFYTLNKHTKAEELRSFLNVIDKGENIGIISEAGVPGVADPGADVVAIAHTMNITVAPLVGPSSILMSVMASGMNGQNFAFVGYIPAKKGDRIKRLRQLEQLSTSHNQTQVFIETPYRNQHLLTDILENCAGNTRLCVASNITQKSEFIKTKTIKEWKNDIPNIHKVPTIFLIKKD
jgi:16S rRNA (cytidine1402-2'-O)-methyltransferase